ncbi:MAG: hypothetical protein GC185_01130 [Alphaproteobacteria bacterium]|nr:hypothetical protein [Alphaproteobacteria bacterium]
MRPASPRPKPAAKPGAPEKCGCGYPIDECVSAPKSSKKPKPSQEKPAHPQRKTVAASGEMMALIAQGDVKKLRAHLEESFWKGAPEQPVWDHLLEALKTGKREMVRLLVTYDARPTAQDLEALKAQAGEAYPQYLRLLRQGGLPTSLAAFEEYARQIEAGKEAAEKAASERKLREQEEAVARAAVEQSVKKAMKMQVESIPAEWRKVLFEIQSQSASEAVIAGGALRDLFNDRPVKDVDIFLKTRGSERKNRKFLKSVFNAAGLKVQEQVTHNGGYSIKRNAFPDPGTQKFKVVSGSGYGRMESETRAESWKVIAGPEKTEYNVVFMSEEFAARVNPPGSKGPGTMKGIIEAFDFGLCQIATDGESIAETPLYKKDVAEKTITLDKGNSSSKEHLQRIVKKYPDWKLDEGAKKMLAYEPPKPRRPMGIRVWY